MTAGVREHFERIASGLLEGGGSRVDGVFVVEVTGQGGGCWTLDLRTDPPMVREGDDPGADCRLTVGAEDVPSLFLDRYAGQRLAWQGRLQVAGDHDKLHDLDRLLFGRRDEPSSHSGYYRALSHLVPDPRLVFMNLGFSDGEQPADLAPEDRPWAPAISLLRRVVAGVELDESRVLDVGCGRGGGASYLVRYHRPRWVVGIDECSEQVHFCVANQALPNLVFLCADAHRIPFEDLGFDVVVNVESSHCYRDRRAAFAEMARVLREGGKLCWADVVAPEDLAIIRQDVVAAGLEIEGAFDLSEGVARALVENRETWSTLLGDMEDPALENRWILRNLEATMNDVLPRVYSERRRVYACLRLVRREAGKGGRQ